MKLSRLTLSNKGSISRSFRIYGYVEWMLGNNPNRTAPFVACRATENKQVLFASNRTASRIPAARPSSR